MGLKPRWFRAHMNIAKPKFHGLRTADVASTSSASATIAVNGYFHQRDFDNAEDRITLEVIQRPLSEVSPATTADAPKNTKTNKKRPKSTPSQADTATTQSTDASGSRDEATAKGTVTNGEVPRARAEPPRGKVKAAPSPATPKGKAKPASKNTAPVPDPTNETVNPLFALVGKRAGTAQKPAEEARGTGDGEATVSGAEGGGAGATAKSQDKKGKKKKEPQEPKPIKEKVAKEKATKEKPAKDKSAKDKPAKDKPAKEKTTKNFLSRKDKNQKGDNSGDKSKAPKPPEVDPGAPKMRNPLLSYGNDARAQQSEVEYKRRARRWSDDEDEEEEFLRTGNIKVKAPVAGAPSQGMKKVAVERKAISSYDDDDEFDA
ncbi:nucleolar protein dao-5-like [Ischnura elegans]|uniref:nucleolar protein dao-5-like n=1 Tax=Ischnura elegans TaxID=197161 RepID=UPI001ED8B209|nr:nucleolar protein dao-5-like [Ischnura elegans]